MLDIPRYLERIGYAGPLAPTAETLAALQEAHLLTVPFENLNIVPLKRPIVLDEEGLYQKIVIQRRGGFCYEANGLFSMLLRALGFPVALLSAGVAHQDGGFGPPFDHLVLLVTLAERWLVDVGFGDSFRRPLRLEAGIDQVEEYASYRLTRAGEDWTLFQRTTGDWEAQHRFPLQPHALSDFLGMCHYHQTSPDSSFTRRRVCTRATPRGRVTLSDLRLIITEDGNRTERDVPDEAAFGAALLKHFGIDLNQIP